jgi:hypothetical protein
MKEPTRIAALSIAAIVVIASAGSSSAEPWKFGVMSDTQWTCPTDPAGKNPNGVPVSIIEQINAQFVKAGVRFVIQVGDLTENGNDADLDVRNAAAQPLIDAGIGFFPMRGNHETYASPANDYAIPRFQLDFPQTRSGEFTKSNGRTFRRGRNFSSPTDVSIFLDGMSYSFDYGRRGDTARFVILDDWATPSQRVDAAGYPYGYSIAEQQDWITSRLNRWTRGTEHAFVFSHQNLIGENHQDCLFNGYTNANPDMQNAFFASLMKNGVRYYISGHDHIHQRSLIASPDGLSKVEELIAASNSSKFYTPKALTDAKWYGQKVRETSVSQERYTVGYYVFTVDGPCVTVEYYSDDHGNWQSDASYPEGPSGAGSQVTPTFNFVKKETWGYCTNGKEFLVPQGANYTTVQDRFEGTTARILDGTNWSTAVDYNARPLTKTVDTGWEDVDRWCDRHPEHRSHPRVDLGSDVLTLKGMADLGSDKTDTYALSMSYDHRRLLPFQFGKGLLGLVTRDGDGRWVNAVDTNVGGTPRFVLGRYRPGYPLGTYGIDVSTRTVWAVVNHEGDFAAAGFRHFGN